MTAAPSHARTPAPAPRSSLALTAREVPRWHAVRQAALAYGDAESDEQAAALADAQILAWRASPGEGAAG